MPLFHKSPGSKAIKVVKAHWISSEESHDMVSQLSINYLTNQLFAKNRQPKPTENDNAYYRHHLYKFSICTCSGVASSLMLSKELPSFPISVSGPIYVLYKPAKS
jgi:hypothetical protein